MMQQQEQHLETQVQLQQDSLLLLQLLMCTFEQQPDIEKQGFTASAATIADSAAKLISRLAEDSSATAAAAVRASAGLATSTTTTAAAMAASLAGAAEHQFPQLLASWFDCVLPTLLDLLERLLRQAQFTAQESTVTAAASSSSSSSSRRPRSDEAGGVSPDVPMQLFVALLAAVAEHWPAGGVHEGPVCDDPVYEGQQGPMQPSLGWAPSTPSRTLGGWAEHYTRICTSIEASMRLHLATSSSSNSSSRGPLASDPMRLGHFIVTVAELLVPGSRTDELNVFVAVGAAAGPGSPQQRHLVSLLFSMLKASATLSTSDIPMVGNAGCDGFSQLAYTAVICLDAADWPPCEAIGSKLTTSDGGDDSECAAAAAAAATAAAAAAAAVGSLPALVLCGRCWLACAQQLSVWQQQQQVGEQLLLLRQLAAAGDPAEAAALLQVNRLHALVVLLAGPDAECIPYLQSCSAWLSQAHIA
jgi:hypothetical protein